MNTDKHRSNALHGIAEPVVPPLGLSHLCPSVSICGSNRLGSSRGTVTLVALCFVAVMGITLAGYIAVCSRAMNLSNRTFQTNLSKQLAEVGVDEALRAFNKNNWADWSSSGTAADWTVSGTAATCNLTFPAGKFGQGVTGSVKIRIDNYNANQLDSTWSSSATYRINDLVGYNGTWYRSLRNNSTNQTPSTTSLTWWVPNPMPWTWSSDRTYSQYEMVNYKGIWYRCITTPPVSAGTTTYAPQVPLPAATYWTPIPTQRAWNASVAYDLYDVVAYTNPTTGDITLYRCLTAHTSTASFSTDSANWSNNVQTVSLAWNSGTIYTRGSIVYYIGGSINRWYYCRQSGTSSTAPSADTTMWAPMWYDVSPAAANPAADTIVVGTKYYLGDYVYYGGSWYRCTTAHTYASWVAGNWTSTNANPYLQLFYFGPSSLSTASNSIFFYAGNLWYRYVGAYTLALTGGMHTWNSSSINYNVGDAVYYSTNSRWYRCILAHTSSGSILPTNTTYWSTAPLRSNQWDSNRVYNQNDTVFHNGTWYLSLQSSHYGQTPTTASSIHWAAAPSQLTAWESGRIYNLNTVVSYSGTWYRCILTHTSSGSILPTNGTYWAVATGAAFQWDSLTAYSAGAYCSYGGVWYLCLSGNTGQTPNNTTYWSAVGAPVVYAEGSVTFADGTSTRTQVRSTIAPAPLFPNAVAATTTINANSGGTVDSYDSTTGTYASQVNSSSNYSAVVAAGSTSGTAVTLSSTAVRGYVAAPSSSTSPYAPLFSSGGSVKGLSSPASPNIDLTRISRSPYIPQFTTLPSGGLATTWANVPKGTAMSISYITNLGTPGDTTPSRYYYNGDLTVGNGSLNILRINGPVILYINGDLNITDSGSIGRIEIASTGSAEIHVAGEFMASAAGEGILNYTANPKSVIIISDTTSTNTHYYSEGVNPFYGVIYIPYSTSTTGYFNDNNNANIYGAVSANEITYSGANLNVHYDTSLRYTTFGGVDQPYTVTEWRELLATEQATMP